MPPANVTEAVTRKVADLARLELTDSEVQTFTAQLGKVLQHVDQLQEVDVAGVEPLYQPFDIGTPAREDVVQPSPTFKDSQTGESRPRVLKDAPEVMHDGFKVPPIL